MDEDIEFQQASDKLAIGLEQSMIIAIVQYCQITESFSIVARVRFEQDQAKILAPYDRLFSYQDKLLLGFPRVGGFKIWRLGENQYPEEVELVYKQVKVGSSVFKMPEEPESKGES